MSEPSNKQHDRLKKGLLVLFVLAFALGTGPGLYLVNPDPSAPNPQTLVFGMPVLFVWASVWLVVLIAIVLVAYVRVWSREEETA